MQRLFSFLVLFLVLTTVATSQSRGFIPPLFTLPADGDEVRFTSSEKPLFQLPDYPASQLNMGVEGVVEVQMYVTSEGEVVYSEITVGSGMEEFDQAALASAMRARFPIGYATVKGLPRDFRIAMPFYFLLSPDPEQYWQSRLELARVQQEYEVVMKKFQDFVMERSKTPPQRVKEIQRQMEEKVSVAKNIHRILAEKKETAILRLREQIDEHRGQAPITDAADATWRRELQDRARANVQVALPGSGVVNSRTIGTEGMDRLTQELEMKKSYL
ncbi:MAG: energy transducer TonB [Bacteroidetes bacterium]|nr:energy transducer TonB [Bacteroidota bacterium]